MQRKATLWLLVCGVITLPLQAASPRVMPEGELPPDERLESLVTIEGSYFPFNPPSSAEAWQERRELVRRQILVAAGLWPEMPRNKPRAVIHGRVERDGYTVERVYLESYPGHFVTGSLYRPVGREGRRPAVLSPHGHFRDGRFHAWNDSQLEAELKSGSEVFQVGGRHPLQARCVQLARMGCVVFLYDMLGYADSQQFRLDDIHKTSLAQRANGDASSGFYSPQAELHLQSPLGLQLANSLYALDWLASLPDVDPERIGVTGASGGGSQTFLLCAVDDRPAAAFPAVMVSTAMQGGCGCENACGLRIGTGNVEFAALHAPKPLGMTSADDWTKEMINKGFPELRELYRLVGKPGQVRLASLTQFPHNYNHPSRRAMYEFFRESLKLEGEDVTEHDFVPLTRADATVWNDEHPRPEGGKAHEEKLLAEMTRRAEALMADLEPRDAVSAERYRREVGGAFETLLGATTSPSHEARFERQGSRQAGDIEIQWGLTRPADGMRALPTVVLVPKQVTGNVVVLTELQGKGGLWQDDQLRPEIETLLDGGAIVVAADLYDQGEFRSEDGDLTIASRTNGDDRIAAVTYGYNLTPLAHRAHDLCVLASAARQIHSEVDRVELLALRGGAPYAAASLAISDSAFERAAVDTEGFRFADLDSWRHVHFLPGAVKYGDLPGMLSLGSPCPLWIAGEEELPPIVASLYRAEGKGPLPKVGAGDDIPMAAAQFLLQGASKSAN